MTLCVALGILGFAAWATAQNEEKAAKPAADQAESPSDTPEVTEEKEVTPLAETEPAETEDDLTESALAPDAPKDSAKGVERQDLIASLTIFVLAIFVGFEVITKVPPTLHTPLMSGSNAISGITLVGAVIVTAGFTVSSFVGFVAVILATINVVGGFLVTHRMLAMFRRK
jgi:NAD(P) transhydrogenase subunit alpha